MTLALACEKELEPYFSQKVINRAVARFASQEEQLVFRAIIENYGYYTIAKAHKIDIETVIEIAHKGGDFLLEEKANDRPAP